MSKVYKFFNCRILRNGAIVKDDLWIRDGKIADPREVFWMEKTEADVLIDCTGMLISPGFIDVQMNGGFGVDFSTPSDDISAGVMKVAKGILKHGCTSFCPTVITSPQELYHKVVPNIKRTPGGEHGAAVIGLHLEGPFINSQKRGAHKEELVKSLVNWTVNDVEQFYGSLDDVSIITLAPEETGDMKIIKHLVKKKIVVSVGHTTSDIAKAEEAARKGAIFITHLFNAMLPFHHRDPGVVGLLTSDNIPQPVYYGLIADGIHTHPSATKIAYRSHPNGLVLVTDAIIALGLKPGIHQFGPMTIEKTDDRATIAGTNTLAGSVASMDSCVRKFKQMTGCSTVEALECATLHPAQLLNIQHQKGTTNYGSDADLVFLDEDLNVHATLIAGKPVWIRKGGFASRLLKSKFNLENGIYD